MKTIVFEYRFFNVRITVLYVRMCKKILKILLSYFRGFYAFDMDEERATFNGNTSNFSAEFLTMKLNTIKNDFKN